MRAAAILGLGCSLRDLEPFQRISKETFNVGLPATPDGLDAVLVFGGDGTIHRNLGSLVRLELPVLIVPAGSGNDFARSLGLGSSRNSRDAWSAFVAGTAKVREIDLGLIVPIDAQANARSREYKPASPQSTGHYYFSHVPHYFACVASIGLDADIARRANQLPRWLRRNGGYALTLPRALASCRAAHIMLTTDTSDSHGLGNYEGAITMAAFANTPYYGDGMKIAPGAELDDGQFDVCLIQKIGSLKLLSLFPTVYAGRHTKIKEVQYFRAASARVETEAPVDVYADGEFVCRTPVEMSVAHGALRVITR